MEFSDTQTIDSRPDMSGIRSVEDENALRRLDVLLAENAATFRAQSLFTTEREKFEAELMRRPLSADKAFSYFGLMLGTLPPATIFTKFIIDTRGPSADGAWVLGILLIVNLVSAVVGYFTGKLIGKMVTSVERYRWPVMMALLPLIGVLWGIMAGGAGGFVIFGFGAIFGAILGGMVGAAALPVFVVFHRLLKRGDSIEARHFLPLALGVTFSICSFILGRF